MVFELNIRETLAAAHIRPSMVVYVFMLGSRLWGTANKNSDYDLYVVTKKSVMGAHRKAPRADIHVESFKEFHDGLVHQQFLQTICCFLPEENVIVSNQTVPRIRINPRLVKKAIKSKVVSDFALTEKFLRKSRDLLAYKTRFHTLITLDIGLQLLTDPSNVDLRVGKKYVNTMWMDQTFIPVLQEKLAQLDAIEVEPKKKKKSGDEEEPGKTGESGN